MNVFDEMGIYWAEIADQDQTKEQTRLIKNLIEVTGYILDLACGSGRHSISLSTDGYLMVGLDASRKLLRIAKERSNDLAVILGDMRFLPFKTGVFDATISVDTSFGYLPSEADDMLSLVEIRRVLVPGGKIVLDVFNRLELSKKYQGKNNFTKQKVYSSFSLEQKRSVSGGCLRDRWMVRVKSDDQIRFFNHKVRLYFQSQLQDMLARAGFKVKQVFGGYDMENFSDKSSRLIFLGEKK
jgi:SAM-dependent methyltransferase